MLARDKEKPSYRAGTPFENVITRLLAEELRMRSVAEFIPRNTTPSTSGILSLEIPSRQWQKHNCYHCCGLVCEAGIQPRSPLRLRTSNQLCRASSTRTSS